jgi:TatD DNase family protein
MAHHFIIDTHAHLCDTSFDNDREEVIQRAITAGVTAIIAVSEDLNDAKKNLELATQYPIIKPAAGLYPTHIDQEAAKEMTAFIREHKHQLAAIGEVGLDYWVIKEEDQKEMQRDIFKQFIHLSLELDLPLNIHSRSAGRHVVSMLLEHSAKKVQLHAFDGKWGAAMPAVEAGYYFSVPPSITRSRQKQKLVKQLPLSCLLIETDSPVLAPEPGDRNEPANTTIAIKTIAEIKNLSTQEVTETTFENTRKLHNV